MKSQKRGSARARIEGTLQVRREVEGKKSFM